MIEAHDDDLDRLGGPRIRYADRLDLIHVLLPIDELVGALVDWGRRRRCASRGDLVSRRDRGAPMSLAAKNLGKDERSQSDHSRTEIPG